MAFPSDSRFLLGRGCGQVSYLGGCEVGSLCPGECTLQAFVFILIGRALQWEETAGREEGARSFTWPQLATWVLCELDSMVPQGRRNTAGQCGAWVLGGTASSKLRIAQGGVRGWWGPGQSAISSPFTQCHHWGLSMLPS